MTRALKRPTIEQMFGGEKAWLDVQRQALYSPHLHAALTIIEELRSELVRYDEQIKRVQDRVFRRGANPW
jgi:hypothetical protein